MRARRLAQRLRALVSEAADALGRLLAGPGTPELCPVRASAPPRRAR